MKFMRLPYAARILAFAMAFAVGFAVINYSEPVMARGDDKEIILQSTNRTPITTGKAKVKRRDNYTSIEVKVKDLPPPSSFGAYTTYVVWAVDSATSQRTKIGELPIDWIEKGGDARLKARTDLTGDFNILITAETHGNVNQPSNVVAMSSGAGGPATDTDRDTTDRTVRRPVN